MELIVTNENYINIKEFLNHWPLHESLKANLIWGTDQFFDQQYPY
jgi:hypothetical protein